MNEEKRNQQHIEVIVKINKPDEDCIEVPIDRDLDCKYDNYDNHNNLNDLHEYASLNPEVCENGIKMSSKHRKLPDTSGNNSRMDDIERHSLSLEKKDSKLNGLREFIENNAILFHLGILFIMNFILFFYFLIFNLHRILIFACFFYSILISVGLFFFISNKYSKKFQLICGFVYFLMLLFILSAHCMIDFLRIQ
ncbi:hypothetical protein CWI36_0928p0020 [Hamiltosporidium magnivora]|uniref:Uncharacterized protein n=1 Tax=Hamiltosporidium magnivora TaxID=148818 RepID=A0A4Q9L9E4_9MICR|nr:hypothetical protein CWI36_0928p0020 [Hamiltosporidium magnivora]